MCNLKKTSGENLGKQLWQTLLTNSSIKLQLTFLKSCVKKSDVCELKINWTPKEAKVEKNLKRGWIKALLGVFKIQPGYLGSLSPCPTPRRGPWIKRFSTQWNRIKVILIIICLMSSWVYNWFSWEEFDIFVYYHNAQASLDIDQNENPQNTLQTTGSLLNRIWLTVEQTIYTVNYVTNVKCALKNLKLLKTELRNRSVTLCLMTNSHLSWSKDRMKPFGWQNSFRE